MARKPRSSARDDAGDSLRPNDIVDPVAPEDAALPGDGTEAMQTADQSIALETGDDLRTDPVEAADQVVDQVADTAPAEADPHTDPEETRTTAEETAEATAEATGATLTENASDAEGGAPPAETPAAAQVPPRTARGPGVLTLLSGGVLAAVIGFGAARFVIPEGWPFGPVSQATRDMTQALDAQGARLDSLRAGLDALPGTLTARIEDTATGAANSAVAAVRNDLGGRIDALSADVTLMQDSLARLDDLEARLTDLERRPVADGTASRAAIASFERELADLRDLLEQERARNKTAEAEIERRAQALRDEAAALARQSARATAEDQITRALASGGGFGGALDALGAGAPIPEALRQHAQTGVATLENLQDGFAGAARAALQATADTTSGAIGAFLRTQFGVRSLSPQEGDSVDAILSRAEAAVRAGDLAGALAELDTLPPEGQAAMADWRATAQARKDVIDAAAAVTKE